MGLLDKVKNLFTEEIDEPVRREEPKRKEIKKEELKRREEPKIYEPVREIRTEERKVEIAPARRETAIMFAEETREEPVVKREERSSLYFSDEDFADLKKPVRREEPKPKIKPEPKREIYKGRPEEKESKKNFSLSPIISPVYGVLDKNYSKEDIKPRDIPKTYKSDRATVDDIRNKAFGTLEDELENNLLEENVIFDTNESVDLFDQIKTRETLYENITLDKIDELEAKIIKGEEPDLSEELNIENKKIDEINEIIKNNTATEKKINSKIDNILEELDEIEELLPNKEEMNNNEEIEDNNYYDDFYEEKEEKEELEESDLFNLIDSMYEKRDDE